MKIYDIISETQDLYEGFWTEFTKWALGSKVTQKEITAKIAEKWTAEILAAYEKGVKPRLSTDIRKYIPNKFKDKVSEILDDALKIAKKNVRGQAITQTAGRAAELGQKIWNLSYQGAMVYGVGRPIAEMIYNINELYNQYDKGAIPAENLQHSVQAEITKAVQDVIAAWAGSKIISKTVGAVGWLPSKLPFGMGAKIAPYFDKMSQAGKAAFVVWLQSDQGQETFAKWLVGEALITAALGIPGEGFEKLVSKSFRNATTWFSKFVKTWAIDPIIVMMKPDAPVAAASPQANQSNAEPNDILTQKDNATSKWLAPKGRDAYGRPIQ